MKKIILSVVIIAAIGFTSCTSEKKTEKQEAPKEEVQKEEMNHDKMEHDEMAVAAYQCPMKCEGDKTYADKDTKCPVCKMDLKEVKHEADENHNMDADKNHEENHDNKKGHDKD